MFLSPFSAAGVGRAGAGAQLTLWNPGECAPEWTLSSGNELATLNTEAAARVVATNPKSAGKLYFEILIGGSPNTAFPHSPSIAVHQPGVGGPTELAGGSTNWAYLRDGQKGFNGVFAAYGVSYTAGDTVGCAVDFAAGKIWWAKNGTWQNSGDPAAGTGEAHSSVTGSVAPFASANIGLPSCRLRAAAAVCIYAPPTGFSNWG